MKSKSQNRLKAKKASPIWIYDSLLPIKFPEQRNYLFFERSFPEAFLRGRGVVGIVHENGHTEEYEISPGVAVFVPKNAVHWFRNLKTDEEVEICGVYSKPDAGDYKPEDYIYIGKITEEDKKLK